MFGFQQFKPERSSFQPRTSRVYSPIYTRPRTEIFSKVSSPEPVERRDSLQSSLPDFINSLQTQVQRLSPSFAFKYHLDTPLSQALSFITQSIDEILIVKPNTDQNLKISEASDEKKHAKAKEDLQRAKETSKNLLKYENVLKKKAEKIAKETIETNLLRKKLQELEEQLNAKKNNLDAQEKGFFERQKQEKEKLRKLQEDLERKTLEINDLQERLNKRIQESDAQLKYEKTSIETIEQCLNQSKSQLVTEQKIVTHEKISLEKLKIDLEQQRRSLNEAKEDLAKARSSLEYDWKSLNLEKLKIGQIKTDLDKQQTQLEKEKEELFQMKLSQKSPNRSRGLEDKTFEFSCEMESDIKMQELTEKEVQIEHEYQKLQNHYENTSKVLDERQSFLEEKEESILKAEKDLKNRFDTIKKIESSLTDAKIEMEELKTNTIPDLESQSDVLGTLVKEIQLKKHELEMSIFKLSKEIEFVQKYKKKLDAENEVKDKVISAIPEGQQEQIKEIIEELQNKLDKLLEREEELEEEQMKMEIEKKQMIETAELLKKAHKDLELRKNHLELENQVEKEKLESLKETVESKLEELKKLGTAQTWT
jgi:chromosome segregation ATPase